MRFTESEIAWAARLRGAGLQWDPQPGQYVFDIDGVMKAGSPFQAGVYLVSSVNSLTSAAGGEEAVPERFTWLPTWDDCRQWLVAAGVDDKEVMAALGKGLETGKSDRETLYQLIADTLEASGKDGDSC